MRPLLILAAAFAVALLLAVLNRCATPQPDPQTRAVAGYQSAAALDSTAGGRLIDSARTRYTHANRLYYEKLPAASAALRLHRFDSLLATW